MYFRKFGRYQRGISEAVNRIRIDKTVAKWKTDKQRFTKHYTEN